MKNHSILALGLTLAFPLIVSSQSFSFSFKSSDILYLEESVKSGVGLLSQEYQLEDTLTHQKYTLNNRPYFGKSRSMVLLTETGCIASSQCTSPWENDPNYKQYKDGPYKPVITKTSFKSVADTAWRQLPHVLAKDATLFSDGKWAEWEDSSFAKGFMRDTLATSKENWLVWLTTSGETEEELSFKSVRLKGDGQTLKDSLFKSPAVKGKIAGGACIRMTHEAIGCIRYLLCGVLSPVEDGWKITSVIPEKKPTPALTPVEKPDDTQEKTVTPPKKKCGKDGKDKKNKKGKEKK